MDITPARADTPIFTLEYAKAVLPDIIPLTFLGARMFHYAYVNRYGLQRETAALTDWFQKITYASLPGHRKFLLSVHGQHPFEYYENYELDMLYLPSHWPDALKVWQEAVRICPLHRFNTDLDGRKTNYLLYSADPDEYHEYLQGEIKRMNDPDTSLPTIMQPYNWNMLFAMAHNPRAQLEMMLGLNMRIQANEYIGKLQLQKPIPLLMAQLDVFRRYSRLLPNSSISQWTDYAPPIEWQLLQALARWYLHTHVNISLYQAVVNYIGPGYSNLNLVLRQYPDLLESLTLYPATEFIKVENQPQFWLDYVHDAWRIQWMLALSPVLPKPCIVYRYHDGHLGRTFGPALNLHPSMPDGMVLERLRSKGFLEMRGFTSTTYNLPYVLSKAVSDVPRHLLEIYLPPGAHCCSWPSQEYELILPHRSVLRYVGYYMIGTNMVALASKHSRVFQGLSDAQRRNLEQIKILVFQLVFDGVSVTPNLPGVPPYVYESLMVPQPHLDEYTSINVNQKHRSASHRTRRNTAPTQARRGSSAHAKLMTTQHTVNAKKRSRRFSSSNSSHSM